MNETHLQSTLLGWIIPLAISISVLLRRNKDLRQRLFVLFCGNVTLYYFFSFLYSWQGEPWFERLALSVAILIPQGGLRFFRAFSIGARGMGRLGGVAAVLGVMLLIAVLYPTPLRPAVGPAVLIYVAGFMLVAILNLNVQAKTAATRVEAARIRYLVVGGLLSLSLQVVDRLDQISDLGLQIPPIGLAMTIIYLYIISQTIMRYRILDLYEMMGRFAVLSLMGLTLAMIYTGLVYWAGAGFSINAFLASLVILILFDPLRDLVEGKISDFLFRERHVLEQEVSEIRGRLAHVINIEVMNAVLLKGFESSRRITHASLYLIDPHGRGFDLVGSVGPSPDLSRIEAAQARMHLKISPTGGALVASELAERRERHLQEGREEQAQTLAGTLELLGELETDLLLPIHGEDQLLGLIAIGDERFKDPFSQHDVALLAALAAQVGIAVENSRLYQRTKERDRLAALGQMAAGLAHEIRNPLGSIKGAAQVIEEVEGTTTSSSDGELLGVIVEEVDRLNRVVSDFLVYARPSAGHHKPVGVNEILKRSLQLFETGQEGRIDLVIDLAEDLPECEIDGEQLHQVFLNLALNAAQAMREGTLRLDVSTRVRTVRSIDSRAGGTTPTRFAEVRFADNGPGIDPETLENIFIPFYTTKKHGSGLGLAVCQRIVRDAGGEIEVRSQPGQGTIFTVVLPVRE